MPHILSLYKRFIMHKRETRFFHTFLLLADGNFLLRFLRMKKFRVRESQELLEKYLRMRQENPQWFLGLDVRDPTLDSLISEGYFFALPERDESGRRVFFSVAGEGILSNVLFTEIA